MNAPVFLIGFMGSGKTRIGQELAKKLSWKWVDIDEMIVERSGKSIPEIFSEQGEAVFRELETSCLKNLLREDSLVVSCGGGIVTQEENRNLLLGQPRVVCLRIQPETVFRRVGNDPRRPLLQGKDAMAQIRRLMSERESFYTLFSYQLDVDHRRCSELVETIRSDLEL